MKKIVFYIFFAVVMAVVVSSCAKSGNDTSESLDITGEWSLISSGDLSMDDISVYVSFVSDHFELYQKLGEGRYYVYTGTYTLSGNILSGRYSDGTSWGSDYDVIIGYDSLTMTARNGSGEVSVYTREDIPAEVLGNITVKSSIGLYSVPFL